MRAPTEGGHHRRFHHGGEREERPPQVPLPRDRRLRLPPQDSERGAPAERAGDGAQRGSEGTLAPGSPNEGGLIFLFFFCSVRVLYFISFSFCFAFALHPRILFFLIFRRLYFRYISLVFIGKVKPQHGVTGIFRANATRGKGCLSSSPIRCRRVSSSKAAAAAAATANVAAAAAAAAARRQTINDHDETAP